MAEFGNFFRNLEKESIANRGSISIATFSDDLLVDNLSALSQVTASIATDGFGEGKTMSPERMEKRLLKEGNLLIALDENFNPVGFQVCTTFNDEVERYLYYSRAVRKDQQGKGIGSGLLESSIDYYHPTVVSARSQNPAAIASLLREMEKGGHTVFPIESSFLSSDRATRALVVFATRLGYLENTDLETGVCRHAYSEGTLGDYQINIDHPRIARVEKFLRGLDFDRQNGDALFCLSFIS